MKLNKSHLTIALCTIVLLAVTGIISMFVNSPQPVIEKSPLDGTYIKGEFVDVAGNLHKVSFKGTVSGSPGTVFVIWTRGENNEYRRIPCNTTMLNGHTDVNCQVSILPPDSGTFSEIWLTNGDYPNKESTLEYLQFE